MGTCERSGPGVSWASEGSSSPAEVALVVIVALLPALAQAVELDFGSGYKTASSAPRSCFYSPKPFD